MVIETNSQDSTVLKRLSRAVQPTETAPSLGIVCDLLLLVKYSLKFIIEELVLEKKLINLYSKSSFQPLIRDSVVFNF